MNVEIRPEAAQFLSWEYINGIFVAVYCTRRFFSLCLGQLELHCRRVENDSALAQSTAASAAPGQTHDDDNGASSDSPAPRPRGKGSTHPPYGSGQPPAPRPQSGPEREVKGGQSGEQQPTFGGRPSAADFRDRRPGGRF
jgi:hypothetical protein